MIPLLILRRHKSLGGYIRKDILSKNLSNKIYCTTCWGGSFWIGQEPKVTLLDLNCQTQLIVSEEDILFPLFLLYLTSDCSSVHTKESRGMGRTYFRMKFLFHNLKTTIKKWMQTCVTVRKRRSWKKKRKIETLSFTFDKFYQTILCF